MSTQNPYSAVLDAIWSVLESNQEFCAMVPVGNRVRFSGADRGPVKEEVLTADLPEVRVVPTASSPSPCSSSSYKDVLTFQIQAASGDQRLDDKHYELAWIFTRLFAQAEKRIAAYANQVGPSRFQVARVMAGPVTHGLSDPELNRGIKGWVGLYSLTVEVWFTMDQLAFG